MAKGKRHPRYLDWCRTPGHPSTCKVNSCKGGHNA